MKRFAIFVLAAFLACASPTFDLDEKWSPEEQAEIRRAGDAWAPIVKPHFRPRFTESGDWDVVRRAPAGGYNGLTEHGDREITINPSAPGSSLFCVARHEIGHALGLRHVCFASWAKGAVVPGAPDCDPRAPAGVMDPSACPETFSALDLAECTFQGVCP